MIDFPPLIQDLHHARMINLSKYGRLLRLEKNKRYQVRVIIQYKLISKLKLNAGHGWDVKCIDWHPSKGLLASGSKDNLVKLWDPKSGKPLSTL